MLSQKMDKHDKSNRLSFCIKVDFKSLYFCNSSPLHCLCPFHSSSSESHIQDTDRLIASSQVGLIACTFSILCAVLGQQEQGYYPNKLVSISSPPSHFCHSRLKPATSAATRISNPKHKMKLSFAVLLFCLASHCHGQPIVFSAARTSDDLVQSLIRTHGSKVKKATGMKSYTLDKTVGRLWRVGSMESCKVEIGPTTAIADALLCPSESPSPCTQTTKYIDSQTFTDEIGFHAEYSISASGGLPGVFEATATATYGISYTYTKEYSNGAEFQYEFPVAPGKTCTPTRVLYRQRCKGTIWEVRDDSWGWMCNELSFDFNDKHRWFVREGEDGWFHYVHHRKGLPSQLRTFRSRHGFRPTSCSDATEKIQVRTLDVLRTDNNAKASLEFDNGKSISAITCLY